MDKEEIKILVEEVIMVTRNRLRIKRFTEMLNNIHYKNGKRYIRVNINTSKDEDYLNKYDGFYWGF